MTTPTTRDARETQRQRPGLRFGFGARIFLALVGTVILLVGTSLWIVRRETRTQVEWLVNQTTDRATQALAEVEQLRNETLEPLAGRFVSGVRFQAAMDAAMEENDPAVLIDAARYEIELSALDEGLVSFTDMQGTPLATFIDGEVVDGVGARDPDPLVRAILGNGELSVAGYRFVGDRLYSVQVYMLDFFGRPLGTLTLGFPADDELARRLGEVAGTEVCFLVGDRCVAATPALDDPSLRRRAVDAAAAAAPVTTEWGGRRWALTPLPLPGGEDAGVVQVLGVALDEVLVPFDRIRRIERLAGFGALLLAVLLGLALSRRLTSPVRTLVAATDRVRKGEYDFHVEVASRDEMGDLAAAFNEMLGDLALKERYRGVLDKVVSRNIAEEMLRGEIRLGGETREVTTLFADVRGFTSLSEGMEPQQIIAMLNDWFDQATRLVEASGGVVDKFLGDGLMAIFGAPIRQEDHALRAVEAALRMRQGAEELNREREARGGPPLRVGFGIATGLVVAGNAGSQTRLNYTVMGEPVNLAARLCAEAGPGEILVSPAVVEAVRAAGGSPDVVREPPRRVKGVSRPVEPWRVEGLATTPAGRLASLALAAALISGLLLGSPRSAPAQVVAIDPPTLAELGVGYISPDGFFQLHPSGRLDVEGFVPGEQPPWLIAETEPFASGRLRLFLDAFLGEAFYATTELRVDRGQEPSTGSLTARIQQAFLRVRLWAPASVHVQAGRFTTPFGNYAARRHTEADPFIRPPLHHDHRMVMSNQRVPAAVDGFLGWKDEPDSRLMGLPAVWGTPYPTGIMLLAAGGDLDLRLALVNSAPASEPDQWRPGADFENVIVAHAGYQLRPELHVAASYSQGPYIRRGVADPTAPAGTPVDETRFRSFNQILTSLEATFTRGMTELRGGLALDRWEVPNVDETVTDLSWFLEGKLKSRWGVFGAARFGAMHFSQLTRSTGEKEAWDYPLQRLQVAAGYRLGRNLELRGEYLINRSSEAPQLDTGLASAQLWWRF